MALASGEMGERHFIGAAGFGLHLVDLAGKSIRCQRFRHRVGLKERAINLLRCGPQHAVKSDGVGHSSLSFRCAQAPVQSKGVRRDVGRLTQIAPVAAVSKVRTDSVSLCNRERARPRATSIFGTTPMPSKPTKSFTSNPKSVSASGKCTAFLILTS